MKYNIFINQEKLSKDKELSLSDCAVFDYLHTICGSESEKIGNKRFNGFTWVNLNHLIEEMPLLRIKTISGASRIVSKLAKLGYIETRTDTKNRKLYIKPTDKMMSIFFSGVVASSQQVVAVPQGGRCVQATNHNTRDHNTNIIEDIDDTPVKTITLPLHRGKTPTDRLISLYCTLFSKTYNVSAKINFGMFRKALNELLKSYSEVQVAYLLIVYFNWHGMTETDVKEYNYLTSVAFPIFMFKSNISKYEIFSRNIQKVDFDDSDKLLKLVANYILSTGK
jgi:hypothetical protein